MSYRDIIKPPGYRVTGEGVYGAKAKYSPDEFAQLVEGYVQECIEKEQIPAKSYFCLIINLSTQQFHTYYKTHKDYVNAAARLDTACAGLLEQTALNPKEGDTRNAQVLIRGLAHYAGWKEKQELDHTSSDGSLAPTTIKLVGPDDDSTD